MINTIEELKRNIISTGSLERHLVGCTEEEIVWLERKYGGAFPKSYRDIISLIGYDAGYLIGHSGIPCYFFVDQMVEIIEHYNECITLDLLEGEDIQPPPEKFWPIYTIYYEDVYFIYLNGGLNCPVYIYNYGETHVRLAWNSVWEWIDIVFEEAVYFNDRQRLRRRPDYERIKTS